MSDRGAFLAGTPFRLRKLSISSLCLLGAFLVVSYFALYSDELANREDVLSDRLSDGQHGNLPGNQYARRTVEQETLASRSVQLPALPFVELEAGKSYGASIFAGQVNISPGAVGYLIEERTQEREEKGRVDAGSGLNAASGNTKGDIYARRFKATNTVKRFGFRESFGGNISNPKAITGQGRSVAEVSFFRGAEDTWKRKLPSFNELSLGELWKGIEVTVRARVANVEKLFKVNGGDPREIAVSVDGIDSLEVAQDGRLIVKARGQELAFSRPIAYQEDADGKHQGVEVAYLLRDTRSYGFVVGNYDASKELIIDPVLAATFLGGSLDERYAYDDFGAHLYVGHDSLTTDASGNIYLVTHSRSPDLSGSIPEILNGFDSSYNDSASTLRNDVTIMKLSADLSQVLAATYLGGTSEDNGASIAVAGNGDVLVTGFTRSRDFPVSASALSRIYRGGNADVFVSRLSEDLSELKASTYVGGRDSEYAYTIAELDGKVLVSGDTASTNFPIRSGAYQTTHHGEADGFITLLSSDLATVEKSTYLGGAGGDYIRKLVVSGTNLYIVGNTSSADLPASVGTYDASFNGNLDGMMAKLPTSLDSLSALTYLGGSHIELLDSIVIDGDGKLLIAGSTLSDDYPVTAGAYQSTRRGNYDGVISKLSADLTTLEASTYIGGNAWDGLYDISVHNSELYVVGQSASGDYPVTDNVVGPYLQGAADGIVTRLSGDLTTISASSYFGGSGGVDYALSARFNAAGNLLISGVSNSSDFDIGTVGHDTTHNGGRDAFVAIVTPNLLATDYADHLVVRTSSGASSWSGQAGTSIPIKILATNPAGEVAVGIHGDKSVVLSGPTAIGANVPTCGGVPIGDTMTLEFVRGEATCELLAYKVESVSVDAVYGTLNSAGHFEHELDLVVAPSGVVVSSLSTNTNPIGAGSTVTISVSVKDSYDNLLGSNAAPHTVALNIAGLNSASLNASYYSTGLYRVNYIPLQIGTDVITGTVDGSAILLDSDGLSDGSYSQQVTLGTPYALQVRYESPATVFNSAMTMTANSTKTISVFVVDRAGHVVTTVNGAYNTTFSGVTLYNETASATCAGSILGAAISLTYTNGRANCSLKLVTTETRKLSASASVTGSPSTRTDSDRLAVEVTSQTLDHFRVYGGSTWSVGQSESARVSARDAADNIYTGYTGLQAITFSGLSVSPSGQVATATDYLGNVTPITSPVNLNFVDGEATSAVTGYKTGAYSLDVSGSTKSSSGQVWYDLDLVMQQAEGVALAENAVLSSITNPTGNCDQVSVQLQLKDQYGNPVRSSGETVVFNASGANTATPTVTDHGNGLFVGVYTATNAGTDSITATINGVLVTNDTDGVSDGDYNLVVNEELEQTATWTGAVSTDWLTATNWAGGIVPGACHIVTVNGGTRHPTLSLVSGTMTVKELLLGQSATSVLTISFGSESNKLQVTRDVIVGPNGRMTHSANTSAQTHRLFLDVGRDMTIASGGSIDVTDLGYSKVNDAPGNGPGGSARYSTSDQNTDNGWMKSPGASHGGRGGLPRFASAPEYPATYGSMEFPVDLGSASGDCKPSADNRAGNGGGAIVIFARSQLSIDGQILARGGNSGANWAGGGSGGSVYVSANSLAGTGSISVNGGHSWEGTIGVEAGGGGGGRIAMHYEVNTFTGSISAYGGRNYGGTGGMKGHYGGAGTILLNNKLSNAKQLIVDNQNQTNSTSSWGFTVLDSLPASKKGVIKWSQTEVDEDLTLTSLVLSRGAGISVRPGRTVLAYSAQISDSAVMVEGDLTIANNATNIATSTLVLDSPTGGLTIQDSPTITDTHHYWYQGTYSLNDVTTLSGGGIYGYGGTFQAPSLLSTSNTNLSIYSGTFTANAWHTQTGGIDYFATGQDVTVPNLATLSNVTLTNYGRLNLPALSQFNTGTFYQNGIYNHSSTGLVISAGSTWNENGTLATIGDSVAIENFEVSGVLEFRNLASAKAGVFGNLVVKNGGILRHKGSNTTFGPYLNLQVDSFVVESGAMVDLRGYGFAGASWRNGYGQGGAIVYDYNYTAAGGGGYGGLGGHGQAGSSSNHENPGGKAYGDIASAADYGSSGGSSSDSYSGSGGGLLKLTADDVVIDGTIDVSGLAPTNTSSDRKAGGGSGGSVYIDATNISGAGSILANGSMSNQNGTVTLAGGGGGGGRIALHYNTSSFSGTTASYGGNGYQNGGAGTVFLKDKAETYGRLIIDAQNITGNYATTVGDLTVTELRLLNGAELHVLDGHRLELLDTTLTGTGGAKLVIEDGGEFVASNLTDVDSVEITNYSSLALPLWVNSNNVVLNNHGYYNHTSGHLVIPSGLKWFENGIQSGIGDIQPISSLEVAGEMQFGYIHPNGNNSNSYISSSIALDVDVSSGTTLTPSSNDDGYAEVLLPFAFTFYGEQYSRIAVSTNGRIIPLKAGDAMPSASDYSNTLRPGINIYNTDLISSPTCVNNSGCAITAIVDADSATITWKTLYYSMSGSSDPDAILEFQAKLFADGAIEFHYQDTFVNNSAYDCGSQGKVSLSPMTGVVGATILVSSYQRDDSLFCGGAIRFVKYLTNTPESPQEYPFSFDTLTVRNGGVVSHLPDGATGQAALALTLNTLDIESGGAIDVSGKGFAANTSGGFSGLGAGGGQYDSGGDRGSGGSHGGNGGKSLGVATGPGYGEYANATMAGSAGGHGGEGGGIVLLNVLDSITLNGSILANGNAGALNYGGGAGGSVKINSVNLTGNGSIYASGGASSGNGGGGGGGRIEIRLQNNSFSGSVGAYGGLVPGGTTEQQGGAGTFFYTTQGGSGFDASGAVLVIDNNGVDGASTIFSRVSASTPLDLVSIHSGGKLELSNFDIGHPFTATTLNIGAGGILTHSANQATSTHMANVSATSLTVASGGSIDVTAKGYSADEGAGKGVGYGGGGYGGDGGAGAGGTGGASHGSVIKPLELGSGGGYAGSGGGAIVLNISNSLNLMGELLANGASSDYSGSNIGGAGGSILISTYQLNGDGFVDASGGDGTGSGGGGSGGRIAIFLTEGTFTSSGSISQVGSQLDPPGGANGGGAGSLYVGYPSYYQVTGNGVQEAGTSQSISVTLMDNQNNPLYLNADRPFVLSGPGLGANGQVPTCTSKSGVATAIGTTMTGELVDGVMNCDLVLYRAELASVDVADGTYNSSASSSYDLDVLVGAALTADAGRTLLSASPSVSVAADTIQIAITARDGAGNPITVGGSAVVVTVTGANPAVIPATDNGDGTYSASYTAQNVGQDQITATIAGFQVTEDTEGIDDGVFHETVQQGPIDHLTVTGSATQFAGDGQTITIQAIDGGGVVYNAYDGFKTITLSGANPSLTAVTPTCRDRHGVDIAFGDLTELEFINGEANCQLILYRAENASIDATDGTHNSFASPTSDLDVVVSGALTGSAQGRISATPNPTADGSAVTVDVQAMDAWDNDSERTGLAITLAVVGANSATPTVSGVGGGLYRGTYTPNNVGTDVITGTVELAPIANDSDGLSDGSYHQDVLPNTQVYRLQLSSPADIIAGSRAEYTVGRHNASGNPVTLGDLTVYFYSNSTGGPQFYDAASGGNLVSSITIPDGASSATFWYYDNRIGNWTITASDNSSAPDGNAGILDAADGLGVLAGPTAQYALNSPADIVTGYRAAYVVTRYDAFNNPVTLGAETFYIYSDSTGSRSFYAQASGGSAVTSLAIGDGSSSTDFWYYDDQAGSWTITVSDATPIADGGLGVVDATDELLVSVPVTTTTTSIPTTTTTIATTIPTTTSSSIPTTVTSSVPATTTSAVTTTIANSSVAPTTSTVGGTTTTVNPTNTGGNSSKLRTTVCSEWNGYLAGPNGNGMYNIMEHVNLTSKKLRIKTELRDIGGHLKNTYQFFLRDNQQFDLLVHDLSGRALNSYGQVCSTYKGSSAGSLDGRMVYYRQSADGVIQFAFAIPFENPLRGRSSVLYNTQQPSQDPEEANDFVANWLQLSNVSDKRLRGKLYLHSLDGKPVGNYNVNLRDGARYDYSAHAYGKTAGLARFVPSDGNVDYQFRGIRYLYDNPGNIDSFTSAYPFNPTAGSGETLIAPVDTTSSKAVLEFANTLAKKVTVRITLYDKTGKIRLYNKSHVLKPYASEHLELNRLLVNSSGLVVAKGSHTGSIIASAVHYGQTATLGLKNMYAIALQQPLSNIMKGSYNTYLNQGCTLYLGNASSSNQKVRISMKQSDGTNPTKDYYKTVPARGALAEDICSRSPSNVYGVVTLTASNPDRIYGVVVRNGDSGRYRMTTAVR